MASQTTGQFLERALVTSTERKRDAAQPFDLTLSDFLGKSARISEAKLRSIVAEEHLGRARNLYERQNGSSSDVSAMLMFVAVAAKLVVCDGPLKREEYLALRSAFPLEGGVCQKVRQLFTEASTDPHDVLSYAKLLARAVPKSDAVREQALLWLVAIARADGPVNAKESTLLWQIAAELNLSPARCRKLLAVDAQRSRNPHAILGVEAGTEKSLIRKAYLLIVRQLHPDVVQSKGVLREAMLIAERKTAAVNAAYGKLARPARV